MFANYFLAWLNEYRQENFTTLNISFKIKPHVSKKDLESLIIIDELRDP